MAISDKIYALRNKNGITQEAFAEKLDVTRQSVQKWESGAGLPTIDKLIAIATMFGVTMDYLCDRNDEAVSDGRTDKEYIPDYGKMPGNPMRKALKSNMSNCKTKAKTSRISKTFSWPFPNCLPPNGRRSWPTSFSRWWIRFRPVMAIDTSNPMT